MNADFSRTLALLRQEKGISQRKAAKELGISQALLSHYENGIPASRGSRSSKRRAITTTSRRTICSGARSIATAA